MIIPFKKEDIDTFHTLCQIDFFLENGIHVNSTYIYPQISFQQQFRRKTMLHRTQDSRNNVKRCLTVVSVYNVNLLPCYHQLAAGSGALLREK